MKKFLNEFKAFVLRGNILDMAIGIIIGAAFTGLVKSLTGYFIQPLLTAILTWEWDIINFTSFGAAVAGFLTEVINFVLTAFVLFLLMKGVQAIMSLGKKKEEPKAPTTKTCPFCKSEIALDAVRCPHCTSQIEE
ncbi:MAG: large conductance mechanosensitive channel protein MscL [Clostridia bacterium]|nr:large conductance mechanosensitive channel protein MscL [Clostridia bacterium]